MATLTLPDLPEEVRVKLRRRAARTGRSVEEEARSIIEEAVADEKPMSPQELQAWVAELYGGNLPVGAVDELIAERRREAAME